VAYAAIAAGIKAVYFLHGFQRHTLVYPDFSEVHCFNRHEAEHIRERRPDSVIVVDTEPRLFLETQRLVAIAGDYRSAQELDRCRSFIDWARQQKLPVIIRPHPRDASGYWEQWRGIEGVEISDRDCDFEDFLQVYRPRVLATWFSTTIYDAILNGVLPVTLMRSDFANEVVFPFSAIAINWPEQKAVLQDAVWDSQQYTALLAEKYAAAIGSSPGSNSCTQ
jgi:hypothetical protein